MSVLRRHIPTCCACVIHCAAGNCVCLYLMQLSFRFAWNLVEEFLQNLLPDCSFHENRLETAVISATVPKDPTDSQYMFPETSAEVAQIFLRQRVILYKLSCHSCNYGILIGWSPYNPWAMGIHKFHRRYTQRCLAILEKHQRPNDVDWKTVVRTPMHQYQLDCCRQRRFTFRRLRSTIVDVPRL